MDKLHCITFQLYFWLLLIERGVILADVKCEQRLSLCPNYFSQKYIFRNVDTSSWGTHEMFPIHQNSSLFMTTPFHCVWGHRILIQPVQCCFSKDDDYKKNAWVFFWVFLLFLFVGFFLFCFILGIFLMFFWGYTRGYFGGFF